MAHAIPTITITVHAGDDVVSTESFRRDVINIGKLARSHMRIDDENVSRMHAVIEVTRDGTVEIADQNSTNGTFVNGEQVTRCPLQSGDQILVGDTRLTVEITAPPPKRRAKLKPVEARPLRASVDPLQYLDQEHVETGTGALALEIVIVWGETVLAVHHLENPCRVSVGETEEDVFLIPSEHLSDEESVTLASPDGAGFELRLDHGLEGEIRVGDERLSISDAAVSIGDAVALDVGTRARVNVGKLSILMSQQELPARPTTAHLSRINVTDQAYMALSLMLHLLFLMLLSLIPEEQLIAQRDPYKSRAAMIAAIQVADQERAEEEEEEEEREKRKSDADKDKKKDSKERDSDKKKVKRKAKAEKEELTKLTKDQREKRDRELVKDKGILKVLGDESLSLLDGKTHDMMAPGQDGPATIASIDPNAPSVAAFQAFGGASNPLGGGGDGDFILPHASVTAGGGGGAKGVVDGLSKDDIAANGNLGKAGFKNKKGKVKVDIMTPSVSKGYDKEAVRRVIRAHMGQIKWCYQKELQRRPELGGKIVLFFIIGANGSVSVPKIKSNTMPTPAVGECIAKKSLRWKFPPPPDAGIVKVSYPFLFKTK